MSPDDVVGCLQTAGPVYLEHPRLGRLRVEGTTGGTLKDAPVRIYRSPGMGLTESADLWLWVKDPSVTKVLVVIDRLPPS
jgi:hypothetical protein